MGIRIPVEDSAPSVAFEDAVAFVFEAPGGVPDSRDPRGRPIELDGTLARAVERCSCDMGHGRLTERTCRRSRILRGYSQFPGLHQAVEVTSNVKRLRRGAVVKETTTVAYAATDFSPREAGAEQFGALLRRHWMCENRHHYVRDNHWREDRGIWRTARAAFVMLVLSAISLNILRAASPRWTDQTPKTLRSMAADHTITVAAETLLQKPP